MSRVPLILDHPVYIFRHFEVCSIRKTGLDSLDFVVNRFFMKLFHTCNIDTVKECHMFFCFEMPSILLKRRAEKFSVTSLHVLL